MTSLSRRAFTAACASLLPGLAFGRNPLTEARIDFGTIRYRVANGYRMAYRETGSGDTILFLHGNPTSSYLWRRIAPALSDLGRCVAPDLLGMGHSAKARPGDEAAYGVIRQRDQLDSLLAGLNMGNRVTLVVHDWGSIFGFDWARRHPDRVRGIVHMEAFVEPITTTGTPAPVVAWFQRFRSEDGKRAVLDANEFVEKVLFRSVPTLTHADSVAYGAPFQTPGDSRLPTLRFPQEVPIDGSPEDVHSLMMAAWEWMDESPVAKLFINAEPGAMVVARRKTVARKWRNTTERTVAARHFVPEDAPEAVVAAIREWWALR